MLEQRHMDLAASIQRVTEEVMMRMAREVQRQTGMKNLVLAGGVALNCVANGLLLREGPFENIWIQPAAGDAGGALGAAAFVWYHLMNKPRPLDGHDRQKGSLLGPRYSNEQIGNFLAEVAAPHERFPDERALLDSVAQMMAEGKIVGWFHGRMEFGPRALGARSIIGDARNTAMQATMNLKIKFRESFRPFAPCVLRERVSDYFAMRPDEESPYMLLVAPVLDKHRVALSEADRQKMAAAPDLRQRVNVVRSTLPAITHVDYSARRANRGRKAARALLPAHENLRAVDRLPGHRQHQFQCAGRTDRVHAAGSLPLLSGHRHGRAWCWRTSCYAKSR